MKENNLTLKIKDFECIEKATIELPVGITLTTGESGNGKTSVFRAFRCALLNPPAQNKIRKGAKSAEVEIIYNGNSIKWVRTEKAAKYIINGEEYNKVGNTNAIKLLEGRSGFVTDNKNKLLNLENFKDVLFPFGLSNSDLFKLLENFLPVPDSTKMLQIFKDEETALVKEIDAKKKDLDRGLNKFKVVEKITNFFNIDKLEETKEELVKSQNILNKMISTRNKADRDGKYISSLPKQILVVLDNNLLQTYTNTASSLGKIKSMDKFVRKIKGLAPLEFFTLEGIENLQKIRSLIRKIIKQQVYSKLKKADLVDTLNMAKYTKLVELVDNVNNLKIINVKEIKHIDTNNLEEYNKLRRSLDKIKGLYSEAKSIKQTLTTLKEEKKKVEEKVEKYKTCPTCGNLIDLDRGNVK